MGSLQLHRYSNRAMFGLQYNQDRDISTSVLDDQKCHPSKTPSDLIVRWSTRPYVSVRITIHTTNTPCPLIFYSSIWYRVPTSHCPGSCTNLKLEPLLA